MSENPKHTPGPWEVRQHGESISIVGTREEEPEPNGRTIAALLNTDTEARGDAALIAAAPDMLSALKTVCWALADDRDGEPVNLEELKYNVVDRIIEAVEPGFDGGNTTLDEYRASEAAYIVSAALAKAEGR